MSSLIVCANVSLEYWKDQQPRHGRACPGHLRCSVAVTSPTSPPGGRKDLSYQRFSLSYLARSHFFNASGAWIAGTTPDPTVRGQDALISRYRLLPTAPIPRNQQPELRSPTFSCMKQKHAITCSYSTDRALGPRGVGETLARKK